MKRRKFLVSSGSAVLSGLGSVSQRPSVAFDFSLAGVPTKDPSEIDSIAIGFDRFELTPRYVDENEKATVTISLDVSGHNKISNTTQVGLTNGELTSLSDIGDATPIVRDNISTTDDLLSGDIIVEIDHPSVTDEFRQSFTISSSDIVVQSIVAEEDLVGWWPLNGTNGNASDYSENNNGGTHNGTTRGVAGKMGITATSFDGSDDYINTPNLTFDVPSSTGFTVALWILPRFTLGGSESHDCVTWHDTSNNNWRINHDGPDGGWNFGWTDTNTGIDVGVANEWQHLAMTVDTSGKLRGYHNASEVEKRDIVDSASATTNVNIGREVANGSEYANAVIADVRIYKQRLSEPEIQEIYNKSVVDVADPPSSNDGGIARYRFEDDVTDSFGSNDGTNNGVSFVNSSIRGKVGQFEASNSDRVATTNFTALESETFTISFWANINNQSSFNGCVVQRNSDNRGVYLGTDGNSNDATFAVDKTSSNGFKLRTSSGFRPENEWMHIVGVKGTDSMKLYSNSQPKGELNNSFTPISTGNTCYVGGNQVKSRAYTDGELEEVRIYDRALSRDEVFQLYLYGTKGKDLKTFLDNRNV